VISGTQEGSAVSGTATFTDSPEGLHVVIQVAGVSPGQHGFHIHQYGRCEDDGKAAGGHYNPEGVKHGFLPTDGFTQAHAGDFGNIEIRGDGVGTLELTIPGLRVSGGSHTVGGRSVVLHEQIDDFGQPTGNAGGRIGCGVIAVTAD
jgi:Cu-Zn family superoxide dismutase